MNVKPRRFPYVQRDPALGEVSLLPMLPITLTKNKIVLAEGLVDSGATLNVLPYAVGEQLGADWDQLTIPIKLTGNLASYEARALLVEGVVEGFDSVKLGFAWAKTNAVPVLLG